MNDLENIDLILRDLPDVAADWEQIDDGERVAWSIDWSNEMSALERLTREAAAGLLTVEQQQCLDIVVAKYRSSQMSHPLTLRRNPGMPVTLLTGGGDDAWSTQSAGGTGDR